MPIRVYKPTTNGRRNMSVIDYSKELSGDAPHKPLLKRIARTGGRNHHGRTTSRFRGGGARKMYRVIDFKRRKDGVVGRVKTIEYDPNRSVFISLISYRDGEMRYILSPKGLKVGDYVESGEKVEPRVGNAMPLATIPTGLFVHNVELKPGRGGQLARSAGAQVQLIGKDGDYATMLLPSGEIRRILLTCRATIGRLGNEDFQNVVIGKAGRKRHMGRRPHNRGSAMNPVDHPMGGGEGRRGGGRHPCSPTGKLSKGFKTRKRKKASSGLIVRRRKKK